MKKQILTFGICLLLCLALVSAEQVPKNTPRVSVTLVNQDPDPVDAGDVVEVRFKVENYGEESTGDFIIEILPEYPFSVYSGSAVRNLGKLRAVETGADAFIVDYKLKVDDDAVEGDNEIKLRFKLGQDGHWIVEDDLFIDVEVEEVSFQIGSLETEPTRLVADTDDAKLSVELQNIGEEKAKNVMMKLLLPKGFEATYGYSDQANLGTIDGESSETADFYVDVDEDMREGEYEATLVINYKEEDDEDNEYKKARIKLQIPLKATPLFKITESKTVPEVIRAGDDAELRLVVKNTGSKKAESVSIKAFKEASQPFEFDEKSDFVGLLEPGETGEAVLKFSVDEDATAKTYLLDIEVRTIDDEDVLVFEKKVPVKVSDGEVGFSVQKIIGIAIAVVALIVAAMVFDKRRKKKKK